MWLLPSDLSFIIYRNVVAIEAELAGDSPVGMSEFCNSVSQNWPSCAKLTKLCRDCKNFADFLQKYCS